MTSVTVGSVHLGTLDAARQAPRVLKRRPVAGSPGQSGSDIRVADTESGPTSEEARPIRLM